MAGQTHRIVRLKGRSRCAFTNTSKLADEEIKTALRAIHSELSLDRVVVHFKTMGERRWSFGRAYAGIPGVMNRRGLSVADWDYLITIAVDDDPIRWVHTLAHEAKHIDQYRQRHYRGRGREAACNAFADWFMRECWSGA
jgi:hypothetical protein